MCAVKRRFYLAETTGAAANKLVRLTLHGSRKFPGWNPPSDQFDEVGSTSVFSKPEFRHKILVHILVPIPVLDDSRLM
jgi:hypothetical protein